MTCPCKGWGVQNPYDYRVSPCPECPTHVQVSHALHEVYDTVLSEPVPDWADELLSKLK